MYIAFKWLLFLGVTMWLAMCIFDVYIKDNTIGTNSDDTGLFGFSFKNTSRKTLENLPTQRTIDHSYYDKGQSLAYLHFIMFLAGALAVTTFYKKQEIITFTQEKIALIHLSTYVKHLNNLKNTAKKLSVTIIEYLPHIMNKIKAICYVITNQIKCFRRTDAEKQTKIHTILLKKLKEMTEERKSLGQLLISAIHENKNIRMRYQLETMTKNRLMQHIEDTQKQIKENRSKYVSFQQLYLVTHQENSFLKARLGKLKLEKDEAEKSLMSLVHEIYRSKNHELKAYCSRFIVKSKDKLLNLDVNAEIHEFLDRSSEVTLKCNTPKQTRDIPCRSWPKCGTRITEILNEDDCLVPLVSDVPKLKGLPGEYVWTVKDKNGLIEKLYEYDYESELDNGDTIRRIRQYSVYFDKDCLLDFSRRQPEDKIKTSSIGGQSIMLNLPSSNQKFLTGSKAFQNFLNSNNSIVPIRSPTPPLPCNL